jgi:hypothetical protein
MLGLTQDGECEGKANGSINDWEQFHPAKHGSNVENLGNVSWRPGFDCARSWGLFTHAHPTR